MSLRERAENYDFNELSSLTSINQRFVQSLEDYLFHTYKEYKDEQLFIMGPKGYGKTFNLMKALSTVVREKQDFLPLVFTYKSANTLNLLDPNVLATPEIWGNRLGVLYTYNPKRLFELADAVIFDDLHYICESIWRGKYDPIHLVNLLKRTLQKVKDGGKAILVSEDTLSGYAERLSIDELDEILPEFGMCNPRKYAKYRGKISYLNLFDVPEISYEEWKKLPEIYEIKLEKPLMYFLYHMTKRPRAFIRFCNLFSPKKEINVDDLKLKTLEMFEKKKITKEKLNFYRSLLEIPVLGYYDKTKFLNLGRVLDAVNYDIDTFIEMCNFSPVIEILCKHAASKLPEPYWNKDDPTRVLKREYEEDPSKVQELLKETTIDILPKDFKTIEKLPESKPEYLMKTINLTRTYFMKRLARNTVEMAHMMFEEISQKIGEDNAKRYVSRIFRNLPKYYFSTDDYFILNEPFQLAFEDVLYERPTLELLGQLIHG